MTCRLSIVTSAFASVRNGGRRVLAVSLITGEEAEDHEQEAKMLQVLQKEGDVLQSMPA